MLSMVGSSRSTAYTLTRPQDLEHFAGEERSRRRGQVQDCGGDVLWLAEPTAIALTRIRGARSAAASRV
jgi:hypothetical protein